MPSSWGKKALIFSSLSTISIIIGKSSESLKSLVVCMWLLQPNPMNPLMAVAPAMLLSAVLFAGVHGYSVMGFASVCWSGILWALAYERTRSLLPGMLAHAVNNLLVTAEFLWLVRV